MRGLSTTLLGLLKLAGTVFGLSASILSAWDFKLAKSAFLANFDASMAASPFKSDFVA